MILKQCERKEIDLAQASSNRHAIPTGTETGRFTRVVGVFLHHRDVKVALMELANVGFPTSWITLIGRNSKRYDWTPGLTVCDRFEHKFFGFSEDSRHPFHKNFQRGKYLLTMDGADDAIRCAAEILSHRRGYSEVWHLEYIYQKNNQESSGEKHWLIRS